MKPSTGNTSIVQIKLCCHGAAHFMVGYTVLMQALTCGLGLLLCPLRCRVCSLVNCHRDCADGDTLLCQIVKVLKAVVAGLVIPKSCG